MDAPQAVIALALDHPDGHVIPFHWHSRAQLLYASTGVMTVTTGSGVWVLPPLRAMWVPALTEHQIRASGRLSMRTLYIKPDAVRDFPPSCRIVSVSPLLRELIVYSTTLSRFYEPGSHAGRIMSLILDLIRFRDPVPLDLPIPRDPRLRKIFDQMSGHPADGRTIEEWGARVGATGRTLSRLFRAETGMTFPPVAPATAPARGPQASGPGRARHQHRAGCGLQQPERLRVRFPQGPGSDTGEVLPQ